MEKIETACVVGLGYIGLPTAAVLARAGLSVTGVDVNPRVVDTVNRGEIHIVEEDLAGVVREAVASGRLRAAAAPVPAQAFVLAVPTPFRESYVPDLSYVEAAARAVAKVLAPGNLVILESTSPVGATEETARWMAEERRDLTFPHQKGEDSDVRVAYCPERVLPGRVLKELSENDRVIGGMTRRCAERAEALYRTFVKGECHRTDTRTAEMVKLTENAFRDVNIAFANELSLVCDRLGLNPFDLIRLANRHPRVNILQPGPGVGGHCIAVDPWFIVHSAPREARLIRTAREVNDSKPAFVVDKVAAAAEGIPHPVVACLGLAFKADIDDLRESPAVEVTRRLALRKVGRILAVEPHVSSLPKPLEGLGVELVSLSEALARCHVAVLLVDHREFRDVDRKLLEGKRIVDTRGIWR